MTDAKKKPHKGDAHKNHQSSSDPSINAGELATHYGFAQAFLNSDPELKHIFAQAVKNTWSADRFVAALRNTDWFKTHSANVRNAIASKTSDPAEWKSKVDQMYATVQDEWGKLFGGAKPPTQLRKWAETAQTLGWSEPELVQHMVGAVNFKSTMTQKELGGTAAETRAQLQQLSAQYGVGLGNYFVNHNVQRVLDGSDTIGAVQARIRDLAKQQYTAFADRLDAGETMQSIADPYIQKMADTLEINPNQVKLTDANIQKALTFKDPKTGKVAPMNLADFGDMIRADPRWQYTDNARQAVASVVNGLAQQWGTGA